MRPNDKTFNLMLASFAKKFLIVSMSSSARQLRPSQYRSEAFTLIEVLMVVSILAVLAALAFPVLGKARKVADRTECSNNLRQLSVTYLAMTSDNNGYLIPSMAGNAEVVPSSPWFSGGTWNQTMGAFLEESNPNKKLGSISCPVVLRTGVEMPGNRSTYGLNHYIGKFMSHDSSARKGALKINTLVSPAQTILFSDTEITQSGKGTYQFVSADGESTVGQWHGENQAIMSFCDGSVRIMPADEVPATIDQPGSESSIFWRGF